MPDMRLKVALLFMCYCCHVAPQMVAPRGFPAGAAAKRLSTANWTMQGPLEEHRKPYPLAGRGSYSQLATMNVNGSTDCQIRVPCAGIVSPFLLQTAVKVGLVTKGDTVLRPTSSGTTICMCVAGSRAIGGQGGQDKASLTPYPNISPIFRGPFWWCPPQQRSNWWSFKRKLSQLYC